MAANIIMRETTSGLGGAPTTTEVSSSPMNNIFDNVLPDEATTGANNYRAVDLYNDGDTIAILVDVYIKAETSSLTTQINMGIEASPINSLTGIANETTPPTGVTFVHHLEGNKLSLPNIPAGSYARLWLNRDVESNTANTAEDLASIAYLYA